MLRDAEFFKARLGSLEGANDTGDFIVKLVKDKHVPKAPVTPPIPTSEEEATVANGNGNDETRKSESAQGRTSGEAVKST